MTTKAPDNAFRLMLLLLILLLPILLLGNLFIGSVHIPAADIVDILLGRDGVTEVWQNIVLSYRVPQAVTAAVSGAALAVAGLLMQTLFRNALADPSILGISSGASLSVAIVMLCFGGSVGQMLSISVSRSLLVILAAFIGSMAVMAVVIWFSTRVRNNVMLLIIGIMIGYLSSSVIYVLNFYASSDNIRHFVFWSMGNYSNVVAERLPFFCITVALGLIGASLLIKPLNALLLGENYAVNLGVRLKRVRIAILAVTGLLTSTVTAFCGPIAFIGLAVPHIARLLSRCSNHRQLMPLVILTGAVISLGCNLCTLLPSNGSILPVNTITPIVGAPVVLYIILHRQHI